MTLLCILWSYLAGPADIAKTPLSPVPSGFRLDCEVPALADRRYFHFFHDLKYLLATEGVKNHLAGSAEMMAGFLEFCSLFAEMNSNERAASVHVVGQEY
jgi:hypothetical protein